MAKEWEVYVTGVEELLLDLEADYQEKVRRLQAALFREATRTITRAQLRTPVDEGVLRASGHVGLPTMQGNWVVVELGFGGPAGAGNVGGSNNDDVGYAVYVHENMTAHHPVGQAKYLESVITERSKGFEDRIAADMNAG